MQDSNKHVFTVKNYSGNEERNDYKSELKDTSLQ
jgi:hypothetical protein